MSELKPGGVGLPAVISIALGAAVLGAAVSFAGFALMSTNDQASNKPAANTAPTSEVAATEGETAGTKDDTGARSSVDEKRDSYVRWNVGSYIVDSNRECSYRAGYLDVQINVTNLSEAAIIAGEAYVVIEDLFGNEMMSLNTPIDVRISSGATETIGSTGGTCWSLGNFGDELRLKEMPDPYSATNVTFHLTSLALESGEIVRF